MNEAFVDRFRVHHRYGNGLCDLNPLTKLSLALAVGVLAMVIRSWEWGIVSSILYFFVAQRVHKFQAFLKPYLAAFVGLGLFTVLIRLISYRKEGEALFSIFGWNWTRAGLENGFDMAFFIVGFTGPIILFFLITPIKDLMYALEEKGISPTITYIILVSFQTIADLGKQAKVILDSQKARGIETEGNIFKRLVAFLPIMSPLALSAISYTEEKSIAMDARAFSNPTAHTHLYTLPSPHSWERWLAIGIWIVPILAVPCKYFL